MLAQPGVPLLHARDGRHHRHQRPFRGRAAGVQQEPLGERLESDDDQVGVLKPLPERFQVDLQAVLRVNHGWRAPRM